MLFHFELSVRLLQVAGDFGDELVGANPGRGRQLRLAINQSPDDLRQWPGRTRMCRYVEIRFVERERLNERGEAMQDFANHRGFLAVNIEAGRHDNQVRAPLKGHESRHGRTHAELTRFVVTGGQNSAPIARATHADGLSFQRRLIAHLDRGVEAIHVEMDDGALLSLRLHQETVPQGAAVSKPPDQTKRRFVNRRSLKKASAAVILSQ